MAQSWLQMQWNRNRRFILFCLIGGSGVIVNLAVFKFANLVLGIHVQLAVLLGALIAMTTNFFLNDRLTWKEINRGTVLTRYFQFVMVSLVGIGINLVVFDLLYYKLGIYDLLSNVLGILVATVWNFFLNHFWTFRKTRANVKMKTN